MTQDEPTLGIDAGHGVPDAPSGGVAEASALFEIEALDPVHAASASGARRRIHCGVDRLMISSSVLRGANSRAEVRAFLHCADVRE
jgi:hypothetical protein